MGGLGLILLTAIAAGVAVVVWCSLNPPPQLEITDRGILDRRLSLGWLDWPTIEGAYRPRSPDGSRVLLRVRVDERLGKRLGRRMVRDQPTPRELELPLDLSGTRYTEVEVLQEIMARQTRPTDNQHPPLAPQRPTIPCP